jgi:hypothetical protein
MASIFFIIADAPSVALPSVKHETCQDHGMAVATDLQRVICVENRQTLAVYGSKNRLIMPKQAASA